MSWHLILLIVLGSIAVASLAGWLARSYMRRGLRVPFAVRMINRASDSVIEVIKRPVTIAVLDEVASVMAAGNYTKTAAAAMRENRGALHDMVLEKLRDDPTTGNLRYVPFADRMANEATETTMRVILAVLEDPRMHELVADMLRDSVEQLKAAVRAGAG